MNLCQLWYNIFCVIIRSRENKNKYVNIFKGENDGTEEMPQQLREHISLSEDPSLVPSTSIR